MAQIDKLQKRYEIVSMTLAPPEGEEIRSQAYYVIKAAQEREELQREGDNLDAKIRKAEKEIRALENTLGLISDRNESFRKCLLRADDKSELACEKSSLEKQLNSVQDKARFRERQKKELSGDMGRMELRLREMLLDEHNMANIIEKKRVALEQAHRSLTDQKEKVDRSLKQLTKSFRDLKAKYDAGKVSNIERDIALRDLRDLNTHSVQELVQASEKDVTILNSLHTFFSQVGLPPVQTTLASRPGSQVSLSSSRQVSRAPSRVTSGMQNERQIAQQVVPTKTVELGLDLSAEPSSRRSSAASVRRSSMGSRTSSVSSKASSRASVVSSAKSKKDIVMP